MPFCQRWPKRPLGLCMRVKRRRCVWKVSAEVSCFSGQIGLMTCTYIHTWILELNLNLFLFSTHLTSLKHSAKVWMIKTKGEKLVVLLENDLKAWSNSLLPRIIWQDKASVSDSSVSFYLHLRISVLFPLSSTGLRQNLISPDICFQSKASSLLFSLGGLSIRRINLCADMDHERISVCFLSLTRLVLSFHWVCSVLPACFSLIFELV